MKKLKLLLLLLPFVSIAQHTDLLIDKKLERIAFGSCSKQDQPENQLWHEVSQRQPDLWIWLGDNIYGDTEDANILKQKYDIQKTHPDYQKLRNETEIIGIWDDHDYGVNDGGKEYQAKDESKEALFDFLDVSKNHPANSRAGAYQSYTYLSEGMRIKVILLDARYFRDPLKKDDNDWNVPNEDGEVLGAAQWKWLTYQLQEKADLFILASGIQVIPEEHRFEKWANFPKERSRLFELIAKQVKSPLVLLSGDRHISEVSSIQLKNYPYPLYEVTSSSLTSPWSEERPEPNKYREKNIVYAPNFAELDISWSGNKLKITVDFLGKANEVMQTHQIKYKR